MGSWPIFASPVPATLLLCTIAFLAYRWYFGSRRLLAKVVAAGAEERETLRDGNPEVPRRATIAATSAAAHRIALATRRKSLYGADSTDTTWVGPLLLTSFATLAACAVGAAVTQLFNSQTWSLIGAWQVYLVGVGLPGVIALSKLTKLVARVGNPSELKAAQTNAVKALGFCTTLLISGAAGFAVSKSWGAVDEAWSNCGLALCEIGMGLMVASCGALAIGHASVATEFFGERSAFDDLARLVRILELLNFPPDEPQPSNNGPRAAEAVELEPEHLALTQPQNGAFPAPGPRKELASGHRVASPAKRASVDDDEDRLYDGGGNGAMGLLLATGLLASMAAPSQAANVSILLDKTISVHQVEQRYEVGVSVPRIAHMLELRDEGSTVQVFEWDGTPLSSRRPTYIFDYAPLEFRCSSPFPPRCRYLLERAREALSLKRASAVIGLNETCIKVAAQPPVPPQFSCFASPLADVQATPGLVVIFSDAAPDGCEQDLPRANPQCHVVIVVSARAGDGALAQERIARRVQVLREAGYDARDGATVLTIDWLHMLPPTNTPAAAR